MSKRQEKLTLEFQRQVTNIKDNILRFYHEIPNDPHHRYRSWEHCYKYFQKIHLQRQEFDLDLATLNLAFYLASWGMMRGSSELLQKDYKVHTKVVQELLK
ncbi:MAG: hypothetical protein U0350_06240 [Caldilineaceae bacterium]